VLHKKIYGLLGQKYN